MKYGIYLKNPNSFRVDVPPRLTWPNSSFSFALLQKIWVKHGNGMKLCCNITNEWLSSLARTAWNVYSGETSVLLLSNRSLYEVATIADIWFR